MAEAYVIDAVRTAVGKRNGSLAGIHPIDLGGYAFRGIFERNDVDPGAVDDVIVGCVDAVGGQAGNIGRLAWLAAGIDWVMTGILAIYHPLLRFSLRRRWVVVIAALTSSTVCPVRPPGSFFRCVHCLWPAHPSLAIRSSSLGAA